ncbi:lectin-like domain-containing protein [Lapidilactobacillus luobeiensis]|uniref:lectin-like domain-containing protein n=1 Tax=Lapidilactobacillus luobeiensis TaxID=2950371 RepID=UPI0021C4B2D5|nr:hypothetical protein [Lapidilactobacillus luobeiensis]
MFKKTHRTHLRISLILLIALGGLLLLGRIKQRIVRGAALPSNVTKPTGVDLSQVLINGQAQTFSGNQAQVTTAERQSTITLTTGPTQTGAVWSTDDAYFDLNQETHLGFWLNRKSLSRQPGEGLAFVLQNDSRGSQAITSYQGQPVIGGQSLGVWSADLDDRLFDPQILALTAIQRSWALEFDNHGNIASGSKAGNGNSFDLGLSSTQASRHIAADYPARHESYQSHKYTSLFFYKYYYFSQNHGTILAQDPPMADGNWRHVSLVWDPTTKMMTFSWDDQQLDGSLKPDFKSQAIPIDVSVFNSANGRVRWGFTGTTSARNYQRTELMLDRVPGGVRGAVSSELFNETRNEQVFNNASVHSGDLLTAKYRLNYLPSQLPWEKITIKLDLPLTTKLLDGSTITHNNGTVRPIQKNWLTIDRNSGEQWLDFALIEPLTADNHTVELSIKLRADPHLAEFTVEPALATFNNPHLRLRTETPRFSLEPKRVLTTTDDAALEYYVSQNDTLPKIYGEFTYANATDPNTPLPIENSDFAIKRTLNGQVLPYEPVSEQSQQNGRFLLASEFLDTSQLKLGINEFNYCLVDKFSNHSPVKTIKVILMSGQLRFGTIAETVAFKDTTLTGAKQTVSRRPDWELEVFDDRQQGERVTSWQLLAQATPLKDADGQALAGELVYRQDKAEQSLKDPLVVAQKQIQEQREAINIATDQWSADEGILLRLQANAAAGSYSGQIIWTLQDDPSLES